MIKLRALYHNVNSSRAFARVANSREHYRYYDSVNILIGTQVSTIETPRRSYYIGHCSTSIPCGMCYLPIRESEKVIDEIATAYVNMNLTTAKQFQQLAISHIMQCNNNNNTTKEQQEQTLTATMSKGNDKSQEGHTATTTTTVNRIYDTASYEQMLLQSLSNTGCNDDDSFFSSTNNNLCYNSRTDNTATLSGVLNNNANTSEQSNLASSATSKTKIAASKNTFDVTLESYPSAAKIKLIKELRGVLQLPLQEAKTRVEKPCPHVLASNVSKEDAEKLQRALQTHGAKVQLV